MSRLVAGALVAVGLGALLWPAPKPRSRPINGRTPDQGDVPDANGGRPEPDPDPAPPNGGRPVDALRRQAENLLLRSRTEGTVAPSELRTLAAALAPYPELGDLAARLREEADAITPPDGVQPTPALPVPVWCVGDLPRGVGPLPVVILDRINAALNSNVVRSSDVRALASELEACSPSGGWSGHVNQLRNRANYLESIGR